MPTKGQSPSSRWRFRSGPHGRLAAGGWALWWLLIATPVAAQTVFGALEVRVSSASGPVAHAEVRIESDALVERERSTIPDPRGLARFVHLRPGIYRVVVAAPGFASRAFEAAVTVGRTSEIRVSLSPVEFEASLVVEGAPLVNARSPVLSTTFDAEMLEATPSEREYIDFMDQAPGVTDRSGFGAGGRFEDDNYSRGAVTSAVQINGVNVSRLDFGNTWLNPDFNTIQEIQVIGNGASVEYGNYTGVTVNVVTKAGTNDFKGDLVAFYTDDGLRSDNAGGIDDLTRGDLAHDHQVSLSVGGPIARERLTFFANGGLANRSEAPFGSTFYNNFETFHLQGRLDWQPNPRQAAVLMVNRDHTTDDDLGLLAGSGPEIAFDEDFDLTTWFASWQSNLTTNGLLELRYAGYDGRFATDPRVCCDTPRVTDQVTGQAYNSAGLVQTRENSRNEIHAVYSHYADELLGAQHNLKVGLQAHQATAYSAEEPSGDFAYSAFSFYGYNYVYAYNYSVETDHDEERITAFAEDQFHLGSRVTATVGARLDSTAIEDRRSRTEAIDVDLFSPRLGLAVDLTGSGKTIARASYGTYYEQLVSGGAIANAGLAVNPVTFYFAFLPGPIDPTDTDTLRDLVVRPENVLLVFDGTAVPIDPGADSYHTDALTLGLERQLGANWAASLDWISKRDRDFLIQDDGTPHTYQAFEYTNPAVGTTQTLYRRTDRDPSDFFVTNDPYYLRDHEIWTLAIRRRPAAGWSLLGSVTHQESTGTVPQNTSGPRGVGAAAHHLNPNFFANPLRDGRLEFSREWQIKLLSSVDLPKRFRAGVSFQALSGLPWEPIIRSNLIPELRSNPIFDVILEPRGSRKGSSSEILDLRLERVFELGSGHRLRCTLDGLNLLNDDPPEQRIRNRTTDQFPLEGGSAFGEPRSLIEPRRYRVGLTWSF